MDTTQIFTEIDLLSIIGSVMKWATIFFCCSIVLLVIAGKTKLFSRRTKLAKFIVILYYISIPVYSVLFSIQFAVVKNSEKQIINAIEINKTLISEYAYDFLSVYFIAEEMEDVSLQSLVNTYLDEEIAKYEAEKGHLNFAEKWMFKIKKDVEYAFLYEIIESEAVSKASESMQIDTETGELIYTHSFEELFKEGELVDLFQEKVEETYSSFYTTLLLFFFLPLLIPIIESLIAKKLNY